jgi:hypothetical protein
LAVRFDFEEPNPLPAELPLSAAIDVLEQTLVREFESSRSVEIWWNPSIFEDFISELTFVSKLDFKNHGCAAATVATTAARSDIAKQFLIPYVLITLLWPPI